MPKIARMISEVLRRLGLAMLLLGGVHVAMWPIIALQDERHGGLYLLIAGVPLVFLGGVLWSVHWLLRRVNGSVTNTAG